MSIFLGYSVAEVLDSRGGDFRDLAKKSHAKELCPAFNDWIKRMIGNDSSNACKWLRYIEIKMPNLGRFGHKSLGMSGSSGVNRIPTQPWPQSSRRSHLTHTHTHRVRMKDSACWDKHERDKGSDMLRHVWTLSTHVYAVFMRRTSPCLLQVSDFWAKAPGMYTDDCEQISVS